jgi:hypothetical protein
MWNYGPLRVDGAGWPLLGDLKRHDMIAVPFFETALTDMIVDPELFEDILGEKAGLYAIDYEESRCELVDVITKYSVGHYRDTLYTLNCVLISKVRKRYCMISGSDYGIFMFDANGMTDRIGSVDKLYGNFMEAVGQEVTSLEEAGESGIHIKKMYISLAGWASLAQMKPRREAST